MYTARVELVYTQGMKNMLSLDTPITAIISAMGKPKRARRAPQYRPESRLPARVGRQIRTSADVFAEMEDLRSADREHFVAFDLNVRNRIIARRVISIGSAVGCDAHPREVFKNAILNGACAIILSHNHPSGEPTPSRADIDLTAKLREVGELMGITILDHVIVAAEGFVSLSERGWK